MIAILDCRELKYRIQRKLNHRFGDDIKIKFEHDEAELMRIVSSVTFYLFLIGCL